MHFYRQTPGTYLHHTCTVSMVGLPDPLLLIFPSICTGTLVPALHTGRSLLAKSTKVHLKKKSGARKTRWLSLSNGNQISYRFPSSFRLRCFLAFMDELFKILVFWGLTGVRFLFYLNFITKYWNVYLQKNNTSQHPLPHLRPDLKSCENFCLEQTFTFIKNSSKHISSSRFCQGHSIAA